MNNTLVIDGEFRLVLGIRQAGHAAYDGDRPIGANIAVDAGLRTERRVRRLAHHDNLVALAVIHVGIACGRPFDRRARHVAEPGERGQLGVVAVLRPHRHRIERKLQDIDRRQRPEKRIGVCHRMGDGLHVAGMVAAFPDHRIRVAFGFDVGRFEQRRQRAEQVASISFRAGNGHQIDHLGLFR